MRRYFLLLILTLCYMHLTAQNTASYPTYGGYTEYMQQTASKYKDICRLDTIGTTYKGRLLLCLKITPPLQTATPRPKFFYCAAMHGNELTGAFMLMKMIDSLVVNMQVFAADTLFPEIYICPFANPDGTWAAGDNDIKHSTRYNANLVDLNRNYPDIRTAEDDIAEVRQRETQAFMDYQKKENFNLSCNLHTGSEVFNYPWDSYPSTEATHADDAWFRHIGRTFFGSLNDPDGRYFTTERTDGTVEGGDWYVIYGSRQDWSTYYARCREITLEVSNDYAVKESELENYWHKIKDALFGMFDAFKYGFYGTVYNAVSSEVLQGVKVEVQDYDRMDSEVFTDAYGYYGRQLLEGTYTISFSKEGFYDTVITAECYNGSAEKLDVYLMPKDVNIRQTEDIKVQISPVPCTDGIYVSSNAAVDCFVYDSRGVTVAQKRLNAGDNYINLPNIAAGMYTVTLFKDNKEIFSKRIIKN